MLKNSYILRFSEDKLIHLVDNHEKNRDVILIEGARQVGKTSLVRHVLHNKNAIWIDLQNDRSLVEKLDQTQSFDEFTDALVLNTKFKPSSGQILVIDEAQESKQLGYFVRYMKEKWEHQTVILLGSLMHRLFRDDIRFPVGRVKRFLVTPFNFQEFLRAQDQTYLLEKLPNWSSSKPFNQTLHKELLDQLKLYIQIGGLPEVVLKHHAKKDWQDHLTELSYDYLEDYKRIEGEAKSNLFSLCLKRVCETLGSPSKLTTFVASNQNAYKDLPDLLNLLENWKLVHKVQTETPKQTSNNKIPPKRYIFDHGIRTRYSPLQNLNLLDDPSLSNDYLGGIFENFVLNELIALGIQNIKSWREKTNGSEIDFVVEHNQTIIPIEVKSTHKTHKKHLSALWKFLKLHNLKTGYLVNNAAGEVFEKDGMTIVQVPFYALAVDW